MARAPRSVGAGGKESESVEVLSNAPIEEVELPPIQQGRDGQVVADATNRNPRKAASGPPVNWYRVTRGGMITDQTSGVRTRVHEGKELSDLQYNIRRLQQQGIMLTPIEAPPGAPDFSDMGDPA